MNLQKMEGGFNPYYKQVVQSNTVLLNILNNNTMNAKDIINRLIIDRENTLSVRSIEVVKNPESMANPCIRVGTLPYYEWSEKKEMEYIITYGRFLNCEMLVYRKQLKGDKSYTHVKGQAAAIKEVERILNEVVTN